MSTAIQLDSKQTDFEAAQINALGLHDASPGDRALFLHQCLRTGLDPFAKQIYCITRKGRSTIQIGIDGARLIADRAARARGAQRSEGDCYWLAVDGSRHEVWMDRARPPAGAVYEVIVGSATYRGKAATHEYNAGQGLWAKMPAVMIMKCAEALALRKAFPADLSGLYTDDEMAQANVPANVPATSGERHRVTSSAAPQPRERAARVDASASDGVIDAVIVGTPDYYAVAKAAGTLEAVRAAWAAADKENVLTNDLKNALTVLAQSLQQTPQAQKTSTGGADWFSMTRSATTGAELVAIEDGAKAANALTPELEQALSERDNEISAARP